MLAYVKVKVAVCGPDLRVKKSTFLRLIIVCVYCCVVGITMVSQVVCRHNISANVGAIKII